MKTPLGTSKLVATAAIAVLTIFTFHACVTFAPGTRFGLEIRETFYLNKPGEFIKALGTLSKSAVYDFRIARDNAKTEEFRSGSTLNIKTDKVTMFEVPKSTSAGEFTAIGGHVTQRVYSNSANDIQIILDELKKQEPRN
jgi:hypothetical protein